MTFFNDILINSHDGDYSEIVLRIAKRFSQFHNAEVIIQKIAENKSNIIIKWGEPELLINAHLDTVPPSKDWTQNPYTLVEKDNYLYGLGVCDTKGNIFVLSEAIERCTPKNLAVLFSIDEESNSIESGVSRFLGTNLADKIKRVIVCEPTGNLVAYSHKGYYSFYLVSRAESRHSSGSKYLFHNAIAQMGNLFEPLLQAGFNLGTISGGTAGNIIAPECKLLVSIRSLYSCEHEMSRLQSIVASNAVIETKTILPALTESELRYEYPGKSIDIPLEFWTEAPLFKNRGISPVIYGIGNIEQAHIADEYVSRSSLEKGIKFFINVINQENNK